MAIPFAPILKLHFAPSGLSVYSKINHFFAYAPFWAIPFAPIHKLHYAPSGLSVCRNIKHFVAHAQFGVIPFEPIKKFKSAPAFPIVATDVSLVAKLLCAQAKDAAQQGLKLNFYIIKSTTLVLSKVCNKAPLVRVCNANAPVVRL